MTDNPKSNWLEVLTVTMIFILSELQGWNIRHLKALNKQLSIINAMLAERAGGKKK